MLHGRLLHPQIQLALARAGHGSRVLIADGNYPHWTRRGPNAELVFLNLAPGLPTVTEVLAVLATATPIELAAVMAPPQGEADPPIWLELSQLVGDAGGPRALSRLGRSAFYEAAMSSDVALAVATGDQRLYANVLLTIGVVNPSPSLAPT